MKELILCIFIVAMIPLFAVEVLTEDFESGNIPDSWTQEYLTGEINWSVNAGGQNDHPASAHSGDFNAWFFDNSTDGNTTRLISPVFALTTHSKLNFCYALDDWVNYQDYLRVYYRTAATEEWVLLQSFEEPMMEWEEVSIDLPEPSPTYSICFEGEANWGYGACIDDIVVEDCVMSMLVWNNDNNSHYLDPQTGAYTNCELSITQSLDALGACYELLSFLPTDLEEYDIIFIELGLYCVG